MSGYKRVCVERELYLDDVRERHLPLPSPRPSATDRALAHAAQELVSDLVDDVQRHHIEAPHVLGEQPRDRDEVALLHLAQAVQRSRGGQLVEAHHARERHAAWHEAEARVDKLGDVEQAVVVAAHGDGCGNDDARGVDRLEDALEVALPRHLLDEHGSEALRAQLLVHAEVVDLADTYHPGTARQMGRGMWFGETYCLRTRRVIGTPEMNATSFLFEETRTPTCHSL